MCTAPQRPLARVKWWAWALAAVSPYPAQLSCPALLAVLDVRLPPPPAQVMLGKGGVGANWNMPKGYKYTACADNPY